MRYAHVWLEGMYDTVCVSHSSGPEKCRGDVSYLSFPLEDLWWKNLSKYLWEDGDCVCVGWWGLCMCERIGTVYVWEGEDCVGDYVCIGVWGLCMCGRTGIVYVWENVDCVHVGIWGLCMYVQCREVISEWEISLSRGCIWSLHCGCALPPALSGLNKSQRAHLFWLVEPEFRESHYAFISHHSAVKMLRDD